ncbi:hypothetical protein F4553_000172 [Allocatelliglobosispora scoriae]|uniref:Uncharacterized protein n=1 Tax=Allocatelliglobosispora scoriae TaxID=643052 RepID=A0A841BIA3_9ACTN|nr:hypothetical protein [Allocatelliglobosispora scoriae]MBB5866793.1 hypothetical protein [Allocatelliglobosispora scoriae]
MNNTTQWEDLYLRNSFQDTGAYPTGGKASRSPDIIPLGDAPVSNPEALINEENWRRDYGNSTNAGESNYIYLRGRNLSAQDTEGWLYLYYAPSALLLWPTDPLDPSRGWSRSPLSTSSGATKVRVAPKAGERFVTPEPFHWIPKPIHNDHYCLIGRVVTEANPNPIPALGELKTLDELAVYVSQHPNMAQRNVTTINPKHKTTTSTLEYNQGSAGGNVYFNMNCLNVPNGSRVAFSCGTTGPDPMIQMEGTVKNTVGSDGIARYSLALYSNIPAGWQSNLQYTWFSEGRVPLPDMSISFEMIMPNGTTHPVLAAAQRPLTDFGIPAELIPADGPTHGIRMGSNMMKTLPVAVNSSDPDYSGGLRDLVGQAPDSSSLLFSGVTWGDRYSSIFGAQTANYDVAVTRSTDKSVRTETVKVSEEKAGEEGELRAAEADSADLCVDTSLETGTYAGDILAVLTAKNVPIGSEIWFRNLDGSFGIEVQPAPVKNQNEFTVTATVRGLPAGYATKIRSFLRLNGEQLPEGAHLKFSIVKLTVTADEAADPKKGETLGVVVFQN